MNRTNGIALLCVVPLWQALAVGVLVLQLIGCGGGGSSGSQPPPPPADFSLAVNTSNQSIAAGNSISVSLSATASNGFSSQISVQVTGQQEGVSVSPQSFTLVPGTPQSITFSA